MESYTAEVMGKIAALFGGTDEVAALLRIYGNLLEANDHASEDYLNRLLRRHQEAYDKRESYGIPHSISIIQDEVDAERGIPQNFTSKGLNKRKQSLAQIEEERDAW